MLASVFNIDAKTLALIPTLSRYSRRLRLEFTTSVSSGFLQVFMQSSTGELLDSASHPLFATLLTAEFRYRYLANFR